MRILKIFRRKEKKVITGKIETKYENVIKRIKSAKGLMIAGNSNGMLFFKTRPTNKEETELLESLIRRGIIEEIEEENFPIPIRR